MITNNRFISILAITMAILFGVLVWKMIAPNPDSSAGSNNTQNAKTARIHNRTSSPPQPRRRIGSGMISDRDKDISNIWIEGTLESNLARHLLEPFDPEELTQKAKASYKDESRLSRLILRAAANNNDQFTYLIGSEELNEHLATRLSLAVYDYSINGNVESLKYVINEHVDRKWGWDSETIMVLAYVDEWDLTQKVLGSHYMSRDGSGALVPHSFWLTRRYLFPYSESFDMSYEDFERSISEAQAATKGK